MDSVTKRILATARERLAEQGIELTIDTTDELFQFAMNISLLVDDCVQLEIGHRDWALHFDHKDGKVYMIHFLDDEEEEEIPEWLS